MTDCASIDLKHHFLIAMPGLEDETFARSVIYVCEHSARGAMGLIINKPVDMSMRLLFDKVDLPLRREDWCKTRFRRAARCRPSGALCCTTPW